MGLLLHGRVASRSLLLLLLRWHAAHDRRTTILRRGTVLRLCLHHGATEAAHGL